jgi:membrane-bound serine protease (ClpP class)
MSTVHFDAKGAMSRSAGFGKRVAHRSPWRAGVLLALLFLTLGFPLRAEPSKMALLLDIDGPIGPATSDYLHRGMERVFEQDVGLIILRIDTPGGLDTSMREIIQNILSSPVAVVSYVAPSGARAASAGTYIVLASHVAVMAPGTNLGAATPIQIGGPAPTFPLPGREEPEPPNGPGRGQDKEPGEPTAPRPSPTLEDKMVSDAVAYIRGLAQMHGRNADWAEQAVREAASLSAAEALEEGVVDLVASNLDDLLARIDGRPVTILGERRYLDTASLEVLAVEPDWRTRLLAIITNPNIAYVLMLIGIYGIILEFYSPGLIVPGVTGAISLLLALYAFHVLPINYAGLALLLLGLALMVSEAFVPSFGALGLGGAVAFVIGSVMLLETDVPGYGISWMLIGSIAVVSAGFFLLVMLLLMQARRRAVVSGPEEMIGSKGRVVEWSGHDGRIRVHGELWRARSARPLKPGRTVRVVNIENLTLVVESDEKKG